MRNAHLVADIRPAERAVMAQLPDGALMQRAVAGLASVCAGLLGRVYGSRIVVLAGSGDNGGDSLHAAAGAGPPGRRRHRDCRGRPGARRRRGGAAHGGRQADRGG